MNIIEAWQKAKDGQAIRRSLSGKTGITFIKESGEGQMGRRDFLWKTLMDGRSFDDSIPDCVLLAPDWEIVKEHKILETTLRGLQLPSVSRIPEDAKVTIEWDE
jgi:hypothetical protein